MTDPQALLAAIAHWQQDPMLHPLTCRVDSRHGVLYGEAEADTVVLRCPDCGFEQIPNEFLEELLLTRHQRARS